MSFTVNNFAADGSFSLDASPCRISQDLALRICRQRRIVAPSHGLTATVSSAMSNYALTTVETFAVDPDLSGCDIVLGPSWSAKCVERGLPNVVLNIPTYGGSALEPITLPEHLSLRPSSSELSINDPFKSYTNIHDISNDDINPHFLLPPSTSASPSPMAIDDAPCASTSSLPRPQHMPPTGFELLESLLLSQVTSGITYSPFADDLPRLQHSLSLHGIVSYGFSASECQSVLLQHIFSGSCVTLQYSNHDRTACLRFQEGFDTANEMASAAFCTVLSATATQISTETLLRLLTHLGVATRFRPFNLRQQVIRALNTLLSNIPSPQHQLPNASNVFSSFERLDRASLCAIADGHAIIFHRYMSTVTELKNAIMQHFVNAECFTTHSSLCCTSKARTVDSDASAGESEDQYLLSWLSTQRLSLSGLALKRLLSTLSIEYDDTDKTRQLRAHLKSYILRLRKQITQNKIASDALMIKESAQMNLDRIREEWPTPVPTFLKDKIINLFREQTSSGALAPVTCASCAESILASSSFKVPVNEIDMSLLSRPDRRSSSGATLEDDLLWLPADVSSPIMPCPLLDYPDVLLDVDGINNIDDIDIATSLTLCKHCKSSLSNGKIPPLSIANHMLLGNVPDVLKDLTIVEEAMIAMCRAKCWVLQLKEDNPEFSSPISQRGVKGHVIIYPQQPSSIANILPPSLNELSSPICVIFVGCTPPTEEWLKTKAKPLVIRREKVRAALIWLKDHNPLYKDITINHSMLDSLPPESSLPVHVEHILPNAGQDFLTSRYDNVDPPTTKPSSAGNSVPFQNVVITDVDGSASSNELRAAAMRHIKKKGGAYIGIAHDPEPVNEFLNPNMFPMIYPTLYPYGIGGFEDVNRAARVSLKHHTKHLFSLADRRFQEHYSFLFTAFNILQRREILLRTSLKVKKSSFESVAQSFANVSAEAIHVVSERVARGDWKTSNSSQEQQVLNLMKEVNVITTHVPGSSASRVAMRNEIRALMVEKGLPSFYLTINPADVYNPLVKFLGGVDIDIDALLPEQVPDYWEQSLLVAKNPAVAAKFFDIYMNAFISALLGYKSKELNLEGGALGVVKAYYGCVEAQGRGTLHCHMLIWVEGGLNPNEIKSRVINDKDTEFAKKLVTFLDDMISNSIPEDPGDSISVPSTKNHPCSVRGIDINLNSASTDPQSILAQRQKDMHHLVKKCQLHDHTDTCYKYWKGPLSGEPRECRFDLDENNTSEISMFDPETGELNLRCLDGLVNNFNATILEAIRCNMDIKFIGSGASAKAVLYYITDYITKSQLKSHVAFAALELAVKKLGELDETEDDMTMRARKLLQKCAYSMISHQELSAQQVCSYLMGYGDHYTSHEYRNLYWTSFEKFIDAESPLSHNVMVDTIDDDIPTTVSEPQTDVLCSNILSDTESDPLVHAQDISTAEPVPQSMLLNNETSQDSDEVYITVEDGELIPKTAHVLDYQQRSLDLDSLTVWDCIAQIDKVRRKKSAPLAHELLDETESDQCHEKITRCTDDLLASSSYFRPTFDFEEHHPDFSSHIMKVRAADRRFVPVLIGPSIPRRDRPEIYERYCRLMLILFKPWRHVTDLRSNDSSTWADTFSSFCQTCSPGILKKMDNMQILHECKDSKDDHFTQRRNRNRNRANFIPQSRSRTSEEDFGGDNDTQQLLLDHLVQIENARSNDGAFAKREANLCIDAAERGGIFPRDNHVPRLPDMASGSTEHVHESDPLNEQIWKHEYEARYNYWKKRVATAPPNDTSHTTAQFTQMESGIQSLSSARLVPQSLPSSIRQDIVASDADIPVDIDDIINEFTLNREQARAFKIVAEHSLQCKPKPLRMYLGGPGGTGKSRVINALKEFFERRNQGRRFRLASYTGVAAKNISGMTLHAALCLNQRTSAGMSGKSLRDLMAMWNGVDYLFVDEVSMIGCRFLLKISKALIQAKQNEGAFGGMNVIFAGDFSQLPPVGDKRLFAHINPHEAKSPAGQQNMYGKLLWFSIDTVIILSEIMRQAGDSNTEFVSLLGRLREGRCTVTDYNLLNTRLLSNTVNAQGIPIIVTSNECKDALNIRAAEVFANQTGQELHWYYSADTLRGNIIDDPVLLNHMDKINSGKTNQRMSRLPLIIGMPVIISKNFDVEHGVVNGCPGVLRCIRYRVDEYGRRHAISCVIEASTTSGSALHGLDAGCVPVLEDTVDIIFKHPHSGRSCTIKRTQLPIMPAFAITAHKAQGQTLSQVIIDLQSCHGTEAPYVMISRVTSLEGLTILRKFDIGKIQSRESEDRRKESKRLDVLRLRTLVEYGDETEAGDASRALGHSPAALADDNLVDADSSSTAPSAACMRLNRLQMGVNALAEGPRTASQSRAPTTKRKVGSNAQSSPTKRQRR